MYIKNKYSQIFTYFFHYFSPNTVATSQIPSLNNYSKYLNTDSELMLIIEVILQPDQPNMSYAFVMYVFI